MMKAEFAPARIAVVLLLCCVFLTASSVTTAQTVVGPGRGIQVIIEKEPNPLEQCLGMPFEFRVRAEDWDDCGDPYPCQDTVSYSWTDSAGGSGTGTAYTFTPASAGIYTVTVTVTDGRRNDVPWSKTWTVTAVELIDITTNGSSCLACYDKQQSFTAVTNPANQCSCITWNYVNASKISIDGCTLTVRFTNDTQLPYAVIIAKCGTITKEVQVNLVNNPPFPQDFGCDESQHTCSSNDPDEECILLDGKSQCALGSTRYDPGGTFEQSFEYDAAVYFDCESNAWKVRLIKFKTTIGTWLNFHGHVDSSSLADPCQRAEDIHQMWYYTQNPLTDDFCETPHGTIPQECIAKHEETHRTEYMNVFWGAKAMAEALFGGLSASTPPCDLVSANSYLEGKISDVWERVRLYISAELDKLGESTANNEERACEEAMLIQICSDPVIGISCMWCAGFTP